MNFIPKIPIEHVIQQPMQPAIPILEIECVKFTVDLLIAATDVFAKHGATLEILKTSCIIYFPEGTKKYRMIPVTGSERYQIVFPDGYKLMEHENVRRSGLSWVAFDPHDFPLSIQEKYRR